MARTAPRLPRAYAPRLHIASVAAPHAHAKLVSNGAHGRAAFVAGPQAGASRGRLRASSLEPAALAARARVAQRAGDGSPGDSRNPAEPGWPDRASGSQLGRRGGRPPRRHGGGLRPREDIPPRQRAVPTRDWAGRQGWSATNRVPAGGPPTGSGEVCLASARFDLRDFQPRAVVAELAARVLDHQLIDVDGRRVSRAADLLLAAPRGELRLVGVDVSIRGACCAGSGRPVSVTCPTPERVVYWAATSASATRGRPGASGFASGRRSSRCCAPPSGRTDPLGASRWTARRGAGSASRLRCPGGVCRHRRCGGWCRNRGRRCRDSAGRPWSPTKRLTFCASFPPRGRFCRRARPAARLSSLLGFDEDGPVER